MKKSILLLWALAFLSFNGCSGIKGLMIYDKDPTLKSIAKVKALPMLNSVGFEWDTIKDETIHGVNIYRGNPSMGRQGFKRIGSVGNRYATHFVDTHVQPNTSYVYTFTTFSFGKESNHGAVVKVRTRRPLPSITFLKAYSVAPTVVKLLWRPHTNSSIAAYVIERSVNGTEWKYVSQIKGQLMAEYIDTFVHRGSSYRYRIFAKSYDGLLTKPSQVTHIQL